MKFNKLGFGIVRHGNGGSSNVAPTDIAWAGTHTVAEDAALGAQIGGALTFVDDQQIGGTFSLWDDDNGKFGIGNDGASIVVTGVLDYETLTSHTIGIRYTDAGGLFYDESFVVTVTDVTETPPAQDPPPSNGTVVDDSTFTVPVVATVVDGGIKLHGKKAASSLGKFIYNLGAAEAGIVYTTKYDPDFSLLSNTGKNAAVGFVIKQGNDFHFVGLQGNGSTGLNAKQIYGDELWQVGSGFTEVDGGAALHGTQAGPNWIQVEVSPDGQQYTFRTSSDGVTWSDEFSLIDPNPHADMTSPAQFGIGAIFASNDTGSFSIKIDVWRTLLSFENMTWNSADKAAGITLFDSDKEAWHASNSNEYVRATKSMATGKWCWAINVDFATFRTGICLASFNLDTGSPGTGTDNVELSQAGVVRYNSSTLVDYTDYVIGDHILVAFDADAGDIWFGRNGVWNGNPSAGTGAVKNDVPAGTWLPFFGTTSAGPSGKGTLIPFPITPPTGFKPLYPTPNSDRKHWETIHRRDLNSGSAAWNGFNIRVEFTAAQLADKTGSHVRLRLKGNSAAGENAQVDSAHVGIKAASGDAYDMKATPTPGQVLVGAASTFTVNAQSRLTTDSVALAYAPGDGMICAFHFNSAANDTIGALTETGWTHHHKSAAAETGTANVTGYTTVNNALRFVEEIQVYVDD